MTSPSAGPAPPVLAARGLTCVRGGRRLFAGLSFALAAGEWLQVRGGNGAGKTSLLRLLAGLREPERGAVRWRGVPLQDAAEDYFADLIFVGHRDGVHPKLTAAENLRAWADLRGQKNAPVAEALAAVGLAAGADLLCGALSAGQKRKAALARLPLAAAATVWLLDEPLAALDEAGRAVVARMLHDHLHRGGVAVVATHQPLAPGLPRPRAVVLGQ